MNKNTAIAIITAVAKNMGKAITESAIAQFNRKLALTGDTSAAMKVAMDYIRYNQGNIGNSFGTR